MVDEAACMKCGSGAKANDGGGIKPTSRSFYKRELPRSLVDLSSHEGKERFERALQNGEADAFFSLVSSFQTQSHPSFCGLTTLSTVLNALHIDPERVWKHPWRWYSEALLECCLTLEYIEKHGITLDQLAMVARCEGCVTHVWRGLAVDDVRTLIRDSVHTTPPDASEKPELVVASYDRTALSQTGGGHFSPIAAYDQQSDSVLILDVARFKYAPHWVDLALLITATKSVDRDSGLERGFLTFRKPTSQEDVTAHKCCSDKCCSKKWAIADHRAE